MNTVIFNPHLKHLTGCPLLWETMKKEKIKSRPGKVMENENLAKSHGILNFFTNISPISFEKNVLITYTLDKQYH